MPTNLRHILLIAVAVVGVVFVLQNVADVEVQFLLWSFTLPRAVLLLAVLVFGIAIGWVLRGLQSSRRLPPPPSTPAQPVDQGQRGGGTLR